jgi:SAM-dependent methyltransferase
LPFRDEVFDCVVGIHMLEHSQDRRRVVTETGRVLRNEGIYFFSTPNRFSLTPEPCVRVWGVGFLPHRLASRYVRLVKGILYRHIRLMSASELKRLFVTSIHGPSVVSLPRISAVERQMLSRAMRTLVAIYHALLPIPVLSGVMRLCAPLLQIRGRKQCTPIQLPQSKA